MLQVIDTIATVEAYAAECERIKGYPKDEPAVEQWTGRVVTVHTEAFARVTRHPDGIREAYPYVAELAGDASAEPAIADERSAAEIPVRGGREEPMPWREPAKLEPTDAALVAVPDTAEIAELDETWAPMPLEMKNG